MKGTLRFALISLLLSAPVHGQDTRGIDQRDIEFGDTLVCDTREQAERYIAHFKGDSEAAIHAVNREESDPSACGVMSAAFIRGPKIAAVSQGNVGFQIVRILVLGVANWKVSVPWSRLPTSRFLESRSTPRRPLRLLSTATLDPSLGEWKRVRRGIWSAVASGGGGARNETPMSISACPRTRARPERSKTHLRRLSAGAGRTIRFAPETIATRRNKHGPTCRIVKRTNAGDL